MEVVQLLAGHHSVLLFLNRIYLSWKPLYGRRLTWMLLLKKLTQNSYAGKVGRFCMMLANMEAPILSRRCSKVRQILKQGLSERASMLGFLLAQVGGWQTYSAS